ncbi:MAG: hypothetical protein KAH77_01640, partial [Thiomargarita sp.]|nr:hypothetical protein [Thiomargarita sp.]
FQRDNDTGINLTRIKIKTYLSENNTAFQGNIETWLQNKYPEFVDIEADKLAKIMGNLIQISGSYKFSNKVRDIYLLAIQSNQNKTNFYGLVHNRISTSIIPEITKKQKKQQQRMEEEKQNALKKQQVALEQQKAVTIPIQENTPIESTNVGITPKTEIEKPLTHSIHSNMIYVIIFAVCCLIMIVLLLLYLRKIEKQTKNNLEQKLDSFENIFERALSREHARHQQEIIKNIKKYAGRSQLEEALKSTQQQNETLEETSQETTKECEHLQSQLAKKAEECDNKETEYYQLNEEKAQLENTLTEKERHSKDTERKLRIRFKKQECAWYWLHPILSTELKVCDTIIQDIKENALEKDLQISEVLFLDNIMENGHSLLKQTFTSNEALWNYLYQTLDSGKWIHKILRTNDLLHIYFPKESSFQELSHHLDNINGMLRSLFTTLEITLTIPTILDIVPEEIPKQSMIYELKSSVLKSLIKDKVLEIRAQTPEKFVVDIETYGLKSKSFESLMSVFIFNPSEWNNL